MSKCIICGKEVNKTYGNSNLMGVYCRSCATENHYTNEQLIEYSQQKIADLEAKLAEYEKEIKKLNACVDFYKSYYISFNEKVIDELEKVKRYIDDKAYYLEEENFGIEINEYIDNQIKQLKEMK